MGGLDSLKSRSPGRQTFGLPLGRGSFGDFCRLIYGFDFVDNESGYRVGHVLSLKGDGFASQDREYFRFRVVAVLSGGGGVMLVCYAVGLEVLVALDSDDLNLLVVSDGEGFNAA